MILLRGLGREVGHWGAFPALLEEFIPGEKSICIDLPGAGVFNHEKSPLSIEGITDFVRNNYLEQCRHANQSRIAKKLNDKKSNQAQSTADNSIDLVAVSLGGMVASDWLARYPNEIRSCVLINTSFKGLSPMHHRLSIEALFHLVNVARSVNGLKREERSLAMVSNRPEIREQVAKQWATVAELRPMSVENVLRQLWAASRYSAQITKPTKPVLVLSSRFDRMVSPLCSQAIAKAWGVEVVTHYSAGHDLTVDDGIWAAARIRDFWSKNGYMTPRPTP
jgi:pimeloyl-ACP methyl ester carboxylesterase